MYIYRETKPVPVKSSLVLCLLFAAFPFRSGAQGLGGKARAKTQPGLRASGAGARPGALLAPGSPGVYCGSWPTGQAPFHPSMMDALTGPEAARTATMCFLPMTP